MIETLLGGLLGGAFRLAPEILKWLDRQGATADAAWNTGALDALKDAIAAQGHTTGVKWVDGLSSSVRPVITYWFMALYCAAKSASFASAVTAGTGWDVAILHAWTEADQALLAGVLNFWFLGRVFDRVRP
ncbi:MAG: hypothetical protein EBU75_07905 [Betaproteobacteria bacterium]|nr:hypothetical protein [Betaproteobacteria bacterium]